MNDQAKPFFLITGSDLLFNKLDEIERIFFSHYLREKMFKVITISSVIRCVVEVVVYSFRRLSRRGLWNQACLVKGCVRSVVLGLYSQATKRIRWMPWQSEAMKDVEACDKVRGAGKRAVIRTSLNGETHRLSGRYLALNT